MMILWDFDDNIPAINWDGTKPIIEGNSVFIKELHCNCAPPGCGGCSDKWVEHEIGNSIYQWVDKR